MLNNGGGDVLKGLNLLEIGEFLRNKSALYRAFFLFELQKGYCFCLYLDNETDSFVLCEVIIRRARFDGYDNSCRVERVNINNDV